MSRSVSVKTWINRRGLQHCFAFCAGNIAQQMRTQVEQLWGAINQRGILLPALFVFLWQATPNVETAFFYFQTNQLGFQPEFLGRVRLVAAIASLLGDPNSHNAAHINPAYALAGLVLPWPIGYMPC